jgi:hypothetical protein
MKMRNAGGMSAFSCAAISAGSSFGSSETVFSASGLSDNFNEWFEIAVDVLLKPSFPADELEKLKQRQRVQELLQGDRRIRSARPGERYEGGTGVTVVEFT